MHNEYSKNHHETAGHLMTEKVPTIGESATVADVETMLLEKTKDFETINYIYILDSREKLIGVMSIKEVFRAAKSQLVKNLMVKDIISVRIHTDQERVALLALKHNLKSMPVVDKEDKFLGVIASNTLLRIIDNEAVEDIFRFGGIYHKGQIDNILEIPLLKALEHRLPWLLLGLAGGMLAAGIVGYFEGTLSKNIILAAFIPLIVYMADAVGTQTEAFIIRDLAVNTKLNFSQYLIRQITVVALIGVMLSGMLYWFSAIIYKNLAVSLVLCIALFFAIISSVVTGLVIPYLFSKIKLDPANASGPVATILQDILSVVVYFTIATLLL